jgi:hypothetical protein
MGNKLLLPAAMVMATEGVRFIPNIETIDGTEEQLNQHNELKYNLVQQVQGLKSSLDFSHSDYLRQQLAVKLPRVRQNFEDLRQQTQSMVQANSAPDLESELNRIAEKVPILDALQNKVEEFRAV